MAYKTQGNLKGIFSKKKKNAPYMPSNTVIPIIKFKHAVLAGFSGHGNSVY